MADPEKQNDEKQTQDEDEFKHNLERLLRSPPKPHKPKDADDDAD